MPWVKFWKVVGRGSSTATVDYKFLGSEDRDSIVEALKEWVRETTPRFAFKSYGFEVVTRIPTNVRDDKIEQLRRCIAEIQSQITFLEGTPIDDISDIAIIPKVD